MHRNELRFGRTSKKRIEKVLTGNVNEIITKNYFDCIACNDIFEHIYDPKNLLINLKK